MDDADWKAHLHEGRLSEALTAQLESPEPDETALRLLERLTEVRALLRAKRWRDARQVTERLPEPGTEDILPQLKSEVGALEASGAALGRGEADEALGLLERVELNLLLAEAETQRGTAYVFLGDAEAAEGAFKRAIKRDPKHYRAVTNLGNVALEQDRVDEAITLYEEAIRLNKGFSNAHHNLGVAYRRKGQVSRSVAAIRRAQRVSRQRDREEARAVLKTFGGEQRKKYVRWTLYALAAVGVFLLLRAQGVF